MDDVFIGRAEELVELAGLLDQQRLVTIVGPPGVGKTRLVRELVAHKGSEWDGVVNVELASLGTGDDVAAAVAATLGLRDSRDQSVAQRVCSAVGARRLLVVLDNCEHVAQDATALSELLLNSCPGATVLATSRTLLGSLDEQPYELHPLALAHAVDLFRNRAVPTMYDENDDQVRAAIRSLCRRLDCLPLAIELIASRTDLMAPQQLVGSLLDRLSSVAPAKGLDERRHQTVDAAIEWSWKLLDTREQALLRRFSVFSGGATPAAIEAVCAGQHVAPDEVGPILDRLRSRSLVVFRADRYSLLETVRHFVRERLIEAGEAAEARARHLEWAVALAEEAEPHLTGAAQEDWFSRLDAEASNIRAALDWSIREEEAEPALGIGAAVVLWWRARGSFEEGCSWLQRALSISADEIAPRLVGRALFAAALLGSMNGDLPIAVEHISAARQAAALAGDAELAGRVALVAGSLQLELPEWRQAGEQLDTAIDASEQAHDPWCSTHALAILASVRSQDGDLPGALALLRRAEQSARSAGDRRALAFVLAQVGSVEFSSYESAAAATALKECVELTEQTRAPERTVALLQLAELAVRRGDYAGADRNFSAGVEVASREASMRLVAQALHGLGRMAHVRGDLLQARELLERSLSLLGSFGWNASPTGLQSLARVAADQGNLVAARSLADRALSEAVTVAYDLPVVHALLASADIWRRSGDPDRASRDLNEALRRLERLWNPGAVADALEDVAGIAVERGQLEHAARLIGSASALRERYHVVRFGPDHPFYAADRARVEPYSAAVAFGSAMSPDDAVRAALRGPDPVVDAQWATLTPKELDAARLVADGLTDREIAEALFVNYRTVAARLLRIFAKLGVSTRTALVCAVVAHAGEVESRIS